MLGHFRFRLTEKKTLVRFSWQGRGGNGETRKPV